jgi:hypothetical protein
VQTATNQRNVEISWLARKKATKGVEKGDQRRVNGDQSTNTT